MEKRRTLLAAAVAFSALVLTGCPHNRRRPGPPPGGPGGGGPGGPGGGPRREHSEAKYGYSGFAFC